MDMSRDLNDLIPAFRTQVEDLLGRCEASGYPMRPFYTLRTPSEQAILWRQSRSTEEIRRRISSLREQGADFLADCIENVGPQTGRHVTNAIPGLSWHQWREAVDCFWLVDGSAEWSYRKRINGMNGYANYAHIAGDMGLNSGGNWTSFKDWPHVHMRQESNPGLVYSLEEIDRVMRERFGE
jgi:peptidoglycan L-alanyl-D-glutamate endopeptidase CwlK